MKQFIIYVAIGLGYWILMTIKNIVINKILGEKEKQLIDIETRLFLLVTLVEIIVWPFELILYTYVIVRCIILNKSIPKWVYMAEEGMDILIEAGTKED